VTSLEQEVLSSLAENHYAEQSIAGLLTDNFLALERKDFTAKNLYQHVQKNPDLEKKYSDKIEALIGHSDEKMGSLKMMQPDPQEGPQDSDPQDSGPQDSGPQDSDPKRPDQQIPGLQGPAPSVFDKNAQNIATLKVEDTLQAGHTLRAEVPLSPEEMFDSGETFESDETLKNDAIFSGHENTPQEKFNISKIVRQASGRTMGFLRWLSSFSGSVLSFILLSAGKGYTYLKEREKLQFYLKAAVTGIVLFGLLVFMVSTLSHLFKSKPVEKQEKIIEVQMPKPFTIQVAAYLKQSHADKYVGVLKKKGIDATVKKVDGGGKTWFLIRVSQFVDKESAAAYGQKLKQQKIIDDFFVNNK
jgi:hypothetical protein